MLLLLDDKQMGLVLNAGGPDRLSRVQMAQVVAEVRGHNLSLIKHVSASSVCVKAFTNDLTSQIIHLIGLLSCFLRLIEAWCHQPIYLWT